MSNKYYKKLLKDLRGKRPVATYDLGCDQAKILRENKNRSGTYCLINKKNGKRYVGSSIDLCKRLRYYLRINDMIILPGARSAIYSSLKKNGLGDFILVILDTCAPENVTSQEQHYIDSLINIGVDYNLNPKAGS